MINEKNLQLYFIMGSNNTDRDPFHVLQEAINGGITIFQYREKGSGAKTGEDKVQFGKRLRDICKVNNIPFIVNDDINLAIELESDGLHLGQGDTSILKVRKWVPASFPIGVSVSTVEEAILAEQRGASYLGVGPIFLTQTKLGKEPIGMRAIREIKAKTSIPIVAIGGIKKNIVPQIREAGAAGVSVISSISQAKDSQQAAKELQQLNIIP